MSLDPASVHLTLAGILLLCGLGLPIPEDISLISGGYMAHLGVVNVHTVFLVCLAAVLGGDCAAFFLGRFFGRRILGWGPAQRLFSARKQLRVRAYFRKYGSKVIFVGRFLPGLRFSIFFSAGTLHVRPAVFLSTTRLAALLSVPFLVYLAWIFGEHIDRVIRWARRSEYGILVVADPSAASLRRCSSWPATAAAAAASCRTSPRARRRRGRRSRPRRRSAPARSPPPEADRAPTCPRRPGRAAPHGRHDPVPPRRPSQRSKVNSVHSCLRRSRRPRQVIVDQAGHRGRLEEALAPQLGRRQLVEQGPAQLLAQPARDRHREALLAPVRGSPRAAGRACARLSTYLVVSPRSRSAGGSWQAKVDQVGVQQGRAHLQPHRAGRPVDLHVDVVGQIEAGVEVHQPVARVARRAGRGPRVDVRQGIARRRRAQRRAPAARAAPRAGTRPASAGGARARPARRRAGTGAP